MAIVRKDRVVSGYNGNLESVLIHDNAGTNMVESTNGVFVVLEGYMDGMRETQKARLGATADASQEVFLIHNGEVMNDERKYKLSDYVISAGKVARAYPLYTGDIITLTEDLFSGTVAKGDKLAVKANGKLGAGATGSEKIVFTVFEDPTYELDVKMKSFAVKVTRN